MVKTFDWKLEFTTGIPVYKQIMNFVYTEIGRGKLRIGQKLPTIKKLSELLNVNPNTIAKAYKELDFRGVITSRRGEGSFISEQAVRKTKLTDKQKKDKLDELFAKLLTESESHGITLKEIGNHILRRLGEDE